MQICLWVDNWEQDKVAFCLVINRLIEWKLTNVFCMHEGVLCVLEGPCGPNIVYLLSLMRDALRIKDIGVLANSTASIAVDLIDRWINQLS